MCAHVITSNAMSIAVRIEYDLVITAYSMREKRVYSLMISRVYHPEECRHTLKEHIVTWGGFG